MSQSKLHAQILRVHEPVTLFCNKGRNTDIQGIEHTFDWTMSGFNEGPTRGESISSPKFHLGEDKELEINLLVYPQGMEGSDDGQVSICLQSSSVEIWEKCKYEANAAFSLVAVNDLAQQTRRITIDEDFQIEGIGWGIANFCPASSIANSRLVYWHKIDSCSSAVKIRCKIVLVTDNKNTETLSSKLIQSNLLANISSLFTDRLFTDVTFVVGRNKLYAHKAILAARSDVFRAMFESDMEEARTNIVKITDARADAFKALLQFIYTGKLDCLETLGEELLCMAEKYALMDLKDACERSLMKRLSMENACQVLVLADRFRAARLRQSLSGLLRRN